MEMDHGATAEVAAEAVAEVAADAEAFLGVQRMPTMSERADAFA